VDAFLIWSILAICLVYSLMLITLLNGSCVCTCCWWWDVEIFSCSL
jgi:hypothetical protein